MSTRIVLVNIADAVETKTGFASLNPKENGIGLMSKYQLLLAFIAAGLVAQPGRAAIINSALLPGTNTITDVSAERFLDSKGIPITSGTHVIATGDIIEGIAKFSSLNTNSFSDLGLPAGYQLNAYMRLKITGFATGVDSGGHTINYVTFSSGFSDSSGALAKFYETDTTLGNKVDFTTQSAASSISKVTAESHLFDIVASGSNDFFIFAGVSSGETINTFLASLSGSGDSSHLFNFGMTVGNNTGGADSVPVPIAPNGASSSGSGLFPLNSFDVSGNGHITLPASHVNKDWKFGDLTTANFAVVPEPSSVISFSLGAAILAIGFFSFQFKGRGTRLIAQ